MAICKPYDLVVTDVGSNSAIIHWKTTEMSTMIENFRVTNACKLAGPSTDDNLFFSFRFFVMELATMYQWMASTCWILTRNFNMLPRE